MRWFASEGGKENDTWGKKNESPRIYITEHLMSCVYLLSQIFCFVLVNCVSVAPNVISLIRDDKVFQISGV